MEIPELHPWPKSYHEAITLQESLAGRIILKAPKGNRIIRVAGLDVSSISSRGIIWAAVVILKLPEMVKVEEAFASMETDFPYIPGLLSFRELPVVIAALRKLKQIPDALICDGQGLAHPRFFGLACHLGLWLNLPTAGCAKSRLVGEAPEPGLQAGKYQPIRYKHRIVGSLLRTRIGVKPVYVSPGHLMDVAGARRLVLTCCQGRRLPEPTRLAHQAVNRARKEGVI